VLVLAGNLKAGQPMLCCFSFKHRILLKNHLS